LTTSHKIKKDLRRLDGISWKTIHLFHELMC
jgi:hypothetical protein